MKTCLFGRRSNGLAESFPYTASQGITPLSLLLIFLLAVPFAAADGDPYNDGRSGLDRATAIILIVFFVLIFTGGSLFIYYNDCIRARHVSPSEDDVPPVGRRRKGLVKLEIESFPTFRFSEVKNLTLGQRALDCAVCLAEFADDATLRLLPKCDHAFHSHCIDTWLAKKTTCPVCRSNLVLVAAEILAAGVELTASPSRSSGDVDGSDLISDAEAATAENSDRFRLRFPEDARKKILAELSSVQALQVAPSARKGYRTGEGGSNSIPGQLLRWTGLLKPAGDGEATASTGGDASQIV